MFIDEAYQPYGQIMIANTSCCIYILYAFSEKFQNILEW